LARYTATIYIILPLRADAFCGSVIRDKPAWALITLILTLLSLDKIIRTGKAVFFFRFFGIGVIKSWPTSYFVTIFAVVTTWAGEALSFSFIKKITSIT